MKQTQKTFCKEHRLSESQFFGRTIYTGSLYLRGLTSIPEGFNPTVGGYLDLNGLTSIPEGFNPTVGGYLDLNGLTSIPEGFNPTVGGSLDLSGLTSIPEGFNPTVGGYLYLNGLTSIPEGFNPTVGGYLDLNGLTSIPEGFNPTVGGSLYLSGLTSIPEGFNPTVGGYLDLRGLTANYMKLNNRIISWQDGKYILADGLFTEVIAKHRKIYTVKKLHQDKVFYLATDGNSTHAHGDTPEQSKADLRFKKVSEKLKNAPIKADTKITVQFYRLLTGACDAGCRGFMEDNGIEFEIIGGKTIEKKPLTAMEFLPLLEKTRPFGWDKFKSLVAF